MAGELTYPTPTIPCISLWQPWATLIAIGAKQIETRSWKTSYRGPIAIHAGKRMVLDELEMLEEYSEFSAALHDYLPLARRLPFGAIVATAVLTDCIPSEVLSKDPKLDEEHKHPKVDFCRWRERDFGDYGPRRFGWTLEGIEPLACPIPYVGRQKLFDVPLQLIGAGNAGRAR